MLLLDWLDTHNGAVIAVATVVNVLVAAAYAFVTWRLWRVARDQAHMSQQVWIEAHLQAEASMAAARAANEQADLIRRMFEASHRPYLAVNATPPDHRSASGQSPWALQIVAPFVLENRGTVPAVVTRWTTEVRHGAATLESRDKKQPDMVLAVFPGVPHTMHVEVTLLDRRPYFESGHPLVFTVRAEYTGLAGKSYSTRLATELTLTQEAIKFGTREVAFD